MINYDCHAYADIFNLKYGLYKKKIRKKLLFLLGSIIQICERQYKLDFYKKKLNVL